MGKDKKAPDADSTESQDDKDKRQAKREEAARLEAEAKEVAKFNVDEFAVGAFEVMGSRLTPELCRVYCEFKRLKDKLQPGRLKPADFVTCIMMAEKGK